MSKSESVYFGCWGGKGHYFWNARGDRTMAYRNAIEGLPWQSVDGCLTPTSSREQGAAALHHEQGWTALAWHDYTVDSRPGSNSALFMPEPNLIFEIMIMHLSMVFTPIYLRQDGSLHFVEKDST